MGPDFADVFLDGFRLFRKVDGHTGHQGAGNPQGLFGGPGRRNERQIFVAFIGPAVNFGPFTDAFHQPALAQHGAFGQARGPRGVGENRHIVAFAPVHQFIIQAGPLLVQLTPQFDDIFHGQQIGLFISPQAFGIPVDDLFEILKLAFDFEDLVHLLLVMGDHKGGIGVLKKIFDFRPLTVRKNTDRHTTGRLCRQLRPEPFGLVFTDNADFVFALETQFHEPQTQIPHPFVIILPGEGFPDSHVFDPHGDFAVPVLPGEFSEKLGQGI